MRKLDEGFEYIIIRARKSLLASHMSPTTCHKKSLLIKYICIIKSVQENFVPKLAIVQRLTYKVLYNIHLCGKRPAKTIYRFPGCAP
jgi:hypothetical protein